MVAWHSNATLSNGVLSARVYLPLFPAYYESSRFDWSSQVGMISLGSHEAFGEDLWRAPHDEAWPESGLGLSSEFGCGEDGAVCSGASWASARDAEANESYPITNGVLGYEAAATGDAFLKIGVGKLVRGGVATPRDALPRRRRLTRDDRSMTFGATRRAPEIRRPGAPPRVE